MCCGGGHLHKECPEKENSTSTPVCCNCKLAEGENPHSSNYRGCSHAKEEIRRRKSQKEPKVKRGSVFSSNYTTPGLAFAAALRNNAEKLQQPQIRQVAVATESTGIHVNASAPLQQKEAGQSVPVHSVNNEPIDDMYRVITVVQQIMTELKCAVSERNKILTITNIVFNLMKQSGQ
jgi:hypothetical protein